jgi:hypothetical protein
MRPSSAILILALAAGGLTHAAEATAPAPSDTSSASKPKVVRVFYLQGNLTDANGWLRRNVPIGKMAWINDRGAFIVIDAAEMVDKCEKPLRERAFVYRIVDPHKPLDFEQLKKEPPTTRTFHVAAKYVKDALVLVKTIYDPEDVIEIAEGDGISVRAPKEILDASEALLKELGFLV